jgi:enoyl-CoA hydratase
MTELVHYDVSDQVATITLDSPHNRNALSRELVDALSARLAEAGREPAARGVVLTHAGRVFCAGADLNQAGTQSMTGATTAIAALLAAIMAIPKPVIACVTGHVRAGGMGLVGACDLAVATETASFAFTEVRIGLTPAIISLTTLDLMTPRAAARYYLTGETFGAEDAASAGLITTATSNADLATVLDGLLGHIRDTSPQGAAETKRLLTSGRRERVTGQAAAMAELSARLFGSQEAQEGIHAFLEHRPPAWQNP